MEIKANEVKLIKTIGKLFDSDVKMVVTDGGFNIAMGKKSKNSKEPEALAGGSHEAIVAHQIMKDFGSDFHPVIAKSEHERMASVEDKSKYLPSHAISKGIELFTISKNREVEFVFSKHGKTLGQYKAEAVGDRLVISKSEFDPSLANDKKTSQAMSKAIRDKMYELNLSTVENNGKSS